MRNESIPEWVTKSIESMHGYRESLVPCAQKLAAEKSLNSLWKAFEKRHAHGEGFFEGPDNFFKHFVLVVDKNLREPDGYRAMTPSLLDDWRKDTQAAAMKLLRLLMDGYPEIRSQKDGALISDGWTLDLASRLATKGKYESLDGLLSHMDEGDWNAERFAAMFLAAGKPHVMLTYLIDWLNQDAAIGHSITHAASKNSHRNSFIRRMTDFFKLHFGTPMRRHVFNVTSIFFDMGGLTEADIKDVVRPTGGRIPKVLVDLSPGGDSL